MKTSFTKLPASKLTKFILILWIIFVLAHITFSVFAQNQSDRSNSAGTKLQLDAGKALLNFPKTVERYYQTKGFKLSWVEKGHHNPNTETAMRFLDCIRQFGLNPIDYHPNELLYSELKLLIENSDSVGEGQRTNFDMLLTDAIITAMNQLHYGKFNPYYSQTEIDNGYLPHFNADFVLFRIIDAQDFYAAFLKVQPSNTEYSALQKNMQLVLGQYILDSYEYPQANVRKMAINMERLRWVSATKGNFINVNIPSFQLKVSINDSVRTFRAIVGSPDSPTKSFESTLTRITAAPALKVPAELFVAVILPAAIKDLTYLDQNHYSIFDHQHQRININKRKLAKISKNPGAYTARQSPDDDNTLGNILFRIDDQPDGAIYDHRESKSFSTKERATSNGRIKIEKAEQLAKILLIADGSQEMVPVLENALAGYHYKNFYLKKPIPISVTYLTCEMIDGRLIIYKDIYQKDAELERKVFGELPSAIARRKSIKR